MRPAIAVATSIALLAPVGVHPRPDILTSCSGYLYATSGYTKCTAGTGIQRSKLYCSNGVDYSIEYGPWVGRGSASWEECNYGRSAVSISYQRA